MSPYLPLTVSHHDPSGIFAVDATVVASSKGEGDEADTVTLTLGPGTLHDADKGAFPLDGLQLTVRVEDGLIEPIGLRNPGDLSEFQQDGLLDALGTALNANRSQFLSIIRSHSS